MAKVDVRQPACAGRWGTTSFPHHCHLPQVSTELETHFLLGAQEIFETAHARALWTRFTPINYLTMAIYNVNMVHGSKSNPWFSMKSMAMRAVTSY